MSPFSLAWQYSQNTIITLLAFKERLRKKRQKRVEFTMLNMKVFLPPFSFIPSLLVGKYTNGDGSNLVLSSQKYFNQEFRKQKNIPNKIYFVKI